MPANPTSRRRAAPEQLPAAEPPARAALFDRIGAPVLVFDERGKLIECNRAGRLLAGDEQAPLAAVAAELADRLPQLFERLAPAAAGAGADCLEDRREAGRFWRVAVSALPRPPLPGWLALLHDVSDFKREEAELKASKRRLRQLIKKLTERVDAETESRLAQERLLANQTRLAAMGEMVGAIAHQWRQPLATLGMIVQRAHALGSREPLDRGFLDEFKAAAMRQINYMSETIEEFRGFYRQGKQKVPFSPLTCVADALRLFEAQFQANAIRVEVRAPAGNPLVPGFPNEFKQVLLNLLSNARDAIVDSREKEGGPEEGLIVIELSGDRHGIAIEIADNGRGIPDEIAARIFDPYFTTKEETGGTGIGLYVSRMIVEDSLGGRLSLAGGAGGAHFRIELPAEVST